VSGLRCGFLHTRNQRVKDSIGKMSEFQSVSPVVQVSVIKICSNYFQLNHRGQSSAASEYIKINLLPFIFVRHFVFDVFRFILRIAGGSAPLCFQARACKYIDKLVHGVVENKALMFGTLVLHRSNEFN